MTTKYEAIDSTGKTWKRTTRSRTYTHCVVHFVKEHTWDGRTYPPYAGAEWAGRRDLAENVANRWRREGTRIERVEILEAKEVS